MASFVSIQDRNWYQYTRYYCVLGDHCRRILVFGTGFSIDHSNLMSFPVGARKIRILREMLIVAWLKMLH